MAHEAWTSGFAKAMFGPSAGRRLRPFIACRVGCAVASAPATDRAASCRIMCFRVIHDYYRQAHFDLYSGYRTPFYDVTVRLDITALRAMARERGQSLYLTLCHRFTRAAASIEDFRYRFRDGQIVLYNQLHPGLTVPAPGGRFSFANCRFHDDDATFHRDANRVVRAASRAVTLSEADHHNYLYFTALPEVPFTAFSHAPSDRPTDAEPKIAFGMFEEDGDSLWVPTAIQVNHAFIDGRALGELMTAVRHAFDATT